MCERNALAVLVLIGVLVCGVQGCASARGGFPKRSESEVEDLRALEMRYAPALRITDHFRKADADTKKDRDDLVNGRMALIDANYKIFVREFVLQKQSGDVAADVTVIGLNTAGALLDPSGTTRILAGISAGLTGSKASYDKHFYYEQTTKALYAAMNAQRKVVRTRILEGLAKESYGDYPLSRALADLDDYYHAGTFLGGLQSIQQDAAKKDAEAQQQIDLIRAPIVVPTSPEVIEKNKVVASAIANRVPALDEAGLKRVLDAFAAASGATPAPEAYASGVAARDWFIQWRRQNREDERLELIHGVFVKEGLITP